MIIKIIIHRKSFENIVGSDKTIAPINLKEKQTNVRMIKNNGVVEIEIMTSVYFVKTLYKHKLEIA